MDGHRHRAARGIKHPVYDFLFTYYSFRSSLLLRWSPGVENFLEGAKRADLDWSVNYTECDRGCTLPVSAFPGHRLGFLKWAIDYQNAILGREPGFGCFGLHEWAMVYKTDVVRHSQMPLRLSNAAIAEVVEAQGLRCSHYDAFRFFTPDAVPNNRIALTRINSIEHDQGGCIHANMDLYKFAYTIAPFTSSTLLGDCFELAAKAREIDMRASPYDLHALGFKAIAIETKSGRDEYVKLQRTLAEAAKSVRVRLVAEYTRLQDLILDGNIRQEAVSHIA